MSFAACVLRGGPTYTIDGIRFEWSERFGPATVSRAGKIHDHQPGPRSRFWKLVTLWNEQGRRVAEGGECVYEEPPEPVYVRLAGRHHVEVLPGEEPEAVRSRWLQKLGESAP